MTSLKLLILATCLTVSHCADSSSSASSGSVASSSSSSNTYQSRSDSSPAIAKTSGTLGSPYYTNDISSFVNAGGKPESRTQGTSPAAAYASALGSSGSSGQQQQQSMVIPYQALLQALANSATPGANNGGLSSASSNQIASIMSPAALSSLTSAGSGASGWALPTNWGVSLGGGNSLFNMFAKPAQLGAGRRSSLTSRLRSFMNALFRRETSSPYMGSGSSYSYSYRPAPYGFGSTANSGGPSNPFGSSSNLFSGAGFGTGSGLYSPGFGSGGPSSSSSLYGGVPASSSLYSSASNYRPSFVPLPSSSFGDTTSLGGSWGQGGSGAWGSGSPIASYGKNSGGYGSGYSQASASPNYGSYGHNYGSQAAGGSSYQQGAWNGNSNSASASSNSSPSGAIWSSQLGQGGGQGSGSSSYYQDSGLQAAASSYYPASSSSYGPTRLASSSGSSPSALAGSGSQSGSGAASSQFSERVSSASASGQKA